MASNSAHAAHFSHFTQENEDKQSNLGSADWQAVKICLSLLAAIYLAKRNIRKKGILELHEQVGKSAAAAIHRVCFIHSPDVSVSVLRSSTTACTSG